MTELPLGVPVPGWSPPPSIPRAPVTGRFAALEPLDPVAHGDALFDAFRADASDAMWAYLPEGPFHDKAVFADWAETKSVSPDPLFFAVRTIPTGDVHGFLSFLRIKPAAGSAEVGYITFSPLMQRTPVASEAVILTIRTAFELGYRRFEWKCNAQNAKSRRAAERFGFSYEGIFRQAMVAKGRNRDTAWFAMIDKEWPRLEAAYDAWLDPSNFDSKGQQKTRLGDLTRPVLATRDPSLR